MVADTLLLYEVGDVLEIDELWSFVLGQRPTNAGFGLHLCRRTRQIVAFYIGKRDADAARQLEQRIPYPYTLCPMYTDGNIHHMKAFYRSICIGQKRRKSGATSHIERWNNTLRQRLAQFVRKTLSFSKCDVMHRIMLEWFIIEYNLNVSITYYLTTTNFSLYSRSRRRRTLFIF